MALQTPCCAGAAVLVMAVISATGLAVAAPIHDAAAADDTARLEELYRADPGSVNRGDNLGATPLHHAAQGGCVRAVQWLLDHGADPNARRADGGTALHAAAAAGQVKAAEALVRAGAAVAAKDGSGRTPLDVAESRGHKAVVGVLGPSTPGSPSPTPPLAPKADGASKGVGSIAVSAMGLKGQPVAGANVFVEPSGREATTNARGLATLSGLRAGTYVVSVSKEGYGSIVLSPVIVPSGDTVTLRAALQAKEGTIAGTVRDARGNGIPGVLVSTEDRKALATTNKDGRYALTGLPPGRYKVRAWLRGRSFPDLPEVDLKAAGAVPLDITEQAAGGSITGVVRDREGNPVPAAVVSLDHHEATADTGPDGTYTLRGVPDGIYTVTATCRGVGTGQKDLVMVTAGKPATADIVLGGDLGAIAGMVLDEQGKPLPGVIVSVRGGEKASSTSADGSYSLIDLEPGVYELVVSRTGRELMSRPGIVVEAGITTPATLHLAPSARGASGRAPTWPYAVGIVGAVMLPVSVLAIVRAVRRRRYGPWS